MLDPEDHGENDERLVRARAPDSAAERFVASLPSDYYQSTVNVYVRSIQSTIYEFYAVSVDYEPVFTAHWNPTQPPLPEDDNGESEP